MTYARRVDANQREIVDALVRVGCCVLDLSRVGRGVPDLLAVRAGITYYLEVKTRKGRVNQRQVNWAQAWGAPVHVVRGIDEALRAVGLVS